MVCTSILPRHSRDNGSCSRPDPVFCTHMSCTHVSARSASFSLRSATCFTPGSCPPWACHAFLQRIMYDWQIVAFPSNSAASVIAPDDRPGSRTVHPLGPPLIQGAMRPHVLVSRLSQKLYVLTLSLAHVPLSVNRPSLLFARQYSRAQRSMSTHSSPLK